MYGGRTCVTAGAIHAHGATVAQASAAPQQQRVELELDAGHVAGPMQFGQCRRQRMAAVQRDVAVGAHNQNSRALQVSYKVKQQVECAAVGVVQVLEYHQDRLLCRGAVQEVGGGL
jgi:hypothetical protein